jgi:hypothetical protein
VVAVVVAAVVAVDPTRVTRTGCLDLRYGLR